MIRELHIEMNIMMMKMKTIIQIQQIQPMVPTILMTHRLHQITLIIMWPICLELINEHLYNLIFNSICRLNFSFITIVIFFFVVLFFKAYQLIKKYKKILNHLFAEFNFLTQKNIS
jgi:hypothetical protein